MAADKSILDGAFSHTASYSTALTIAWPGVDFTPPSEGLWLEVSIFPNEPDNYSWDDETQEFMGFLQVSVYGRPGSGIYGLTDEAESIIAHFPKGTALGPVRVSQRPYLRPVVIDGEAHFIPVTIPYKGIAG